jgi:hypothetical protein
MKPKTRKKYVTGITTLVNENYMIDVGTSISGEPKPEASST